MKRIKPKRLLGAMTVALTVAVFAVSVLAATPEYLNITSPTAAAWLARKSGAAVTLTFDYTSNPSVPPATTRALGRMCLVGADPANPDLDTVIVEAWQDIPNGTLATASINLTIPASQPEGSYDARVILTNSDGSPITDWELGAIIVDNSPPEAPTILAIADDVNPGPDGYINDTTPTFNWTAATDNGNPASGIAKYWIQIDGKFTWREVAGTTYTVPGADALVDGAYTARVKAEDKAGNVGPEATINFTVDTTAPDAPTLDPEPAYTKGTSNTITWPAVSDPVTNTCEYYAEYTTDNTWATIIGNSGWITETSWTVTGLTGGTYYYRVKARDLAGNVTATSAVEASTQDDVAPTFGSPSPADGAWVITATPTISIPVSDTGAGIDGSSATISIDGGTPVAATYDGVAGTISYTPPAPLAEGTHTVTITVKDLAYPPVGPGPDGNLATVSWDFGVDTVAPTLSGQLPTGNINISNPTLSVDFSDATSGYDAAASPTTFTLDGGAITPDTEPADGALTGQIKKVTSGLAEGSHSVVIQARDLAGNLSNSLSWSFFVDTVAPTPPTSVTVTSPTNDTTPTFTWSGAADGGSGLASYTVEIWSGGAKVRGPYSVAYGADPFSWTVPDADALTPDGSYEIRVWAVDAAGNVSATYGSATVVIDTVAPTLSGNAPTGYINTASPTLTVDFDDTVGATTVSGYGSTTALTLDGGSVLPVSTEPASGDATGTITKVTSGLAEGSYTVSITVADKAGNSTTLGTVASPWTFFVDITDPNPPTGLTVTTPTNDTTPTVTWTAATDPGADATPPTGSGIVGYEVQIGTSSGASDVKAPTSVGNIVTFDDAAWTALGVTLSPDDTYYFQVRAVDRAGNRSTWVEVAITVDTARPALANGSPTTYTADNTPTISADFTDVGVGLDTARTALTLSRAGLPPINVTIGFTGTNYVNGSLSTTIEYTPGTGLADGLWTADMVAYDLAGNKSTPDLTLQWTFNIDTTPPTLPGSPVAGNLGDDGKWYINTLRPTFGWAASVDPDAPDGTPGSGLRDYSFQFGTSATKPASAVDAWPSALVNETGIAPTPGAAIQQWTPSSDLPLAVGEEYSARVKAFDNLNNATLWIDPPIIYDPDPPTAPGTPSTTTPTNDPTPEWSWTGSTDAISGVDGYHIQIRREGSADWDVLDTFLDIPDSTAPADPQTWEQGLQLQDGTYEIRVRAMDVAGNCSDWSGIGTVTVDSTPPAVPGMPQTTSPTNDSTPTWTWGAVSGAASYKVYLDDVLMTDDADETDTQYTPTVALGEGQHYLQVSALDDLGNESAKSEAGYVVIDTTGPVAPVVTRVTPSPTNEAPQIWTWSRPADAVSYDFGESADGTAPPATFTNVGNVDTYETNFTTDGTHYVMVRAYDALGNAGDWSAAASVVIDMTPPGVPTDLAVPSPTNDNTPTWTWTASTGDVASYEVSLDGAAAVDIGNVTSFTPSALADGRHNLKVRALDALRNASGWAGPAEVLVDTVAPVITLINPENGARLNITTASTILADLLDSGSGVDQAKVRLRIDGGEWVAPTAIVGGTLYYVVNLPFEATDDKWHSIEIKAKDVVGNETRVHACFKVELYREGFGFGRLRFPEESD